MDWAYFWIKASPYIAEHIRDIIQSLTWILLGIVAIKISLYQVELSEWQHKVDVMIHKEQWARDDLARALWQMSMMYSIADDSVKDAIIKPTIDNIDSTNSLIGLCRKTIKECTDEYNNIIDNNPMWFSTSWAETISTDKHTKEEIDKRLSS